MTEVAVASGRPLRRLRQHLVLFSTAFATIQLLLGLGTAFRPTVRFALAASAAWSVAARPLPACPPPSR